MTTRILLYAVEGATGPILLTRMLNYPLSELDNIQYVFSRPGAATLIKDAIVIDDEYFHTEAETGDLIEGDTEVRIRLIKGTTQIPVPSYAPILIRVGRSLS